MQPRPAYAALRSLPLVLLLSTACAHGRRPASYLPVGASAQYGDRTADGVTLILAAPESAVHAGLRRALTANGYNVSDGVDPDARVVETAPIRLGGDTSFTARAEIIPEDPAGGGVVVVLSGTFSVPSAGIRSARVVQRPGARNALYGRLRTLGDSTRRIVAAAP